MNPYRYIEACYCLDSDGHKLCRQSELLMAKGQLTEAWQLLGELRKDPQVVGELRVQVLLMESCACVAGGACAVALPLLVEALSTAHHHHLAYLAALTHLHTANVQVSCITKN